MLPTFHPNGEIVLVEHVSTTLHTLKPGDLFALYCLVYVHADQPHAYQHLSCKLCFLWCRVLLGDIVTCTSPDDPAMLVCKRVMALGGDDLPRRGFWSALLGSRREKVGPTNVCDPAVHSRDHA